MCESGMYVRQCRYESIVWNEKGRRRDEDEEEEEEKEDKEEQVRVDEYLRALPRPADHGVP